MEWQRVIRANGRYAEGFDPKRVYEFGRDEWDETQFFKLAECSPFMNVMGLYYRDAPPSAAGSE